MTAPAPVLDRAGRCGAVGSWSPGAGRPRVPWRCRCDRFARSVELSTTPVYPTCVCSHSKAVHALVEVQP